MDQTDFIPSLPGHGGGFFYWQYQHAGPALESEWCGKEMAAPVPHGDGGQPDWLPGVVCFSRPFQHA